MSEVPKILELEKVIEPYLQGGKVMSYNSCYLTKPGDNYGSIMLKINAQIKNINDQVEELALIAKLPPLTNDFYWEIFQPERTCITENAIYKYLSPLLKTLQLEASVLPSKLFNAFPRYYGSRISIDTNTIQVDRNAVLVQENLIARGYRPGNRHKPYDLAHTVLILHNMAQFHALPIALRLKKPQEYAQYVQPYFKKFDMNHNIRAEAKEMMKSETLFDIKAVTKDNDRDMKRVEELLDLYDEFQRGPEPENGLFTTLVHGDLWINNIMVKYDDSDVPTTLKIVDFQITQYESLVHDLIFLLLSSVDTQVVEQNYYNFLHIYYEAFIKSLHSVNIDTQNYSYESFALEVERIAHIQIPHAIFMAKVIKADTSTLPANYKDMDLTILAKNRGVQEIQDKLFDILKLAKKFNIFY